MDDPLGASVKQEIFERTIVGTSKEKPVEINDEEDDSDEEKSVIVLDSDTEQEDNGAEDEEANDEEDSDEEEEDDEDEDESEEDSDSSIDSESVNSVWSTVDEAVGEKITTEAAEVNIIKKFEKAMYLIADKETEKGKKILEKLLDDPIISTYRIEDLDFESFEEPPRLARMLQVFIAVHKNLAKLGSENEVDHLCQAVAYEPNNSGIWFDIAMKSVENGDLDFAKYAFKKCEGLKESLEAHATVLYITCDYGSCLKVLKTYQEETDSLNDKMKYLKLKIRSTSQYYKQLCDGIFEEDEVYAEINVLDQRKVLVFDERIEELKKKTSEKREALVEKLKKENESTSTIPISISAEQDLPTFCTLFCDLFDRIHAFSHPRHQLIEIIEWESRKDYLEVLETVNKMVDIVECVEEMTAKTEEDQKKKKRGKKKVQKKEYLANWRKRLFVEKPTEEVDSEVNTTADEDGGEEDEGSQDERDVLKNSGLPENELAGLFGLSCTDVDPIRTESRRREKTPPPSRPDEFIDCDLILSSLESMFSHGSHTILEFLEGILLLLMEHTPALGALSESMKEVTIEMYNRLALFCPMNSRKYLELNITVMELNCRKGVEVCIKKYISSFHRSDEESEEDMVENSNQEAELERTDDNRLLVMRFLWKQANSGLRDDIKLEYLYSLEGCLQGEEVVSTSSGSFAVWDVEAAIVELEKKKRIESVKHLWKSRNYKDLVEIIENDIEFGSITKEESLEMITFWLQSLEKLKMHSELGSLAVRVLHFYLTSEFHFEGNPNKMENLTESLLMKLQRIDFRKIEKVNVSAVGYLVFVSMKKYKKLEKDWKNWKILYDVIKVLRGESNLEYIETLDKNLEPHAMPLLEMDLLVKAHEVLGEHHCCAQKNYEFLFFVVDRFRELIDDIPTLEMVYMKENGWLWNNMNEELSQILFCMYGKYGKKRKAGEDHENGGKCSTTLETARRILSVILVAPLPLYDEKEKLLHDVVDLINSKFSYLLNISPEKQKNLEDFRKLLRAASNLNDVHEGLQKCRDDLDDYVQSVVWYAMALNAYRVQAHKDASKYSELYLLTDESVHDDRLRASVWGILAHECVHNLFQLDLADMYEQWKWRTMPFRMSVEAHEQEPVPHFELAATLYQLASSLSRFHRYLPKSDPRRAEVMHVGRLRVEAREHFDRSLELTKLGDDGSQPEHQWLCYYFIGKLEAKNGKWDIVKVVESFYEAACGCELAGFYYPQKVQTKKQSNFEPLEVHYQAHAAVHKYLLNNENPPLEVLRKLRIFLKVMNDGHKVVRQSSSLFKISPDVYTVMDELIYDTVHRENKQNGECQDFHAIRKEITDDLKKMCFKAFSLVTDRFPHIKSYFRLAQISFEKGFIDTASEHIFKNVFKRKKKDDGLFDNVIEISCSDINRNGSFNFHIERCMKLGVRIAERLLDLHNIVAMLVAMVSVIAKEDEEHVAKEAWKSVVTVNLTAMEHIVLSRDNSRNTPSPVFGESQKTKKLPHLTATTLRNELWKLWNVLSKCSKADEELIRLMKAKTEVLIVHSFKSVQELRVRMTVSREDGNAKKKYNTQKRKLDFVNMAQPFLKQIAEQNAAAGVIVGSSAVPSIPASTSSAVAASQPSTSSASNPPYLPLSDSDDDIQCIDPPPLKKAPPPAITVPPMKPPVLVPQVVIPKPVAPSVAAPKPVAAKPAAPKPTATPTPSAAGTSRPQPPQNVVAAAAIAALGAANANNGAMANLTQMIAAAATSKDENGKILAAQALQAIQMIHAQAAAQTATQTAQVQAAQIAKIHQAAQAAQLAQALRNAQAAAAKTPQLKKGGGPSASSAASSSARAVPYHNNRPTAPKKIGRPPGSSAASRSSSLLSSSSQSDLQNAARQYLAAAANQMSQLNAAQRAVPSGKPPSASASTPSLAAPAPVRPIPRRPDPQPAGLIGADAALLARLEANWPNPVARQNVVQYLNTITDPAQKKKLMEQLFGTK